MLRSHLSPWFAGLNDELFNCFWTAFFLAPVRGAVATDHGTMLLTTRKLDLGLEHRTTVPIAYYDVEEAGPVPGHSTTYIFNVSYTTTLSVPELMDYLSSTIPSIGYGNKESVLQALNIVMSRKPCASRNIAVFPRSNKFFPIRPLFDDLGGGLIAFEDITPACGPPLFGFWLTSILLRHLSMAQDLC